MTNTLREVLDSLSKKMNNEPVSALNAQAKEEAKQQTVYSLICTDAEAYLYIANNVQVMWEQQQLSTVLEGIPYIILKGSSASIYYPDPMRRSLGDIDILVGPSYFSDAYDALQQAAYTIKDEDERHVHFKHDGISVELHRRFATLNTREQEEMLDGWLYSAVPCIAGFRNYTFPMPPDQLNGLVLLTHINQHLEEGLGLRQMMDWVMYIHHSLDDEAWQSFKEKTDQLGLTMLAMVSARLGQKYLGINKEITWCQGVNESTVDKLIEYIYECGNFGHKDSDNNSAAMVISHGRGIGGFFRNLQNRGLKNWKLVEKYHWLKPFAWSYQLIRYIYKGMHASGLKDLWRNIQSSKRRNELLDELGATRYAFKDI